MDVPFRKSHNLQKLNSDVDCLRTGSHTNEDVFDVEITAEEVEAVLNRKGNPVAWIASKQNISYMVDMPPSFG